MTRTQLIEALLQVHLRNIELDGNYINDFIRAAYDDFSDAQLQLHYAEIVEHEFAGYEGPLQ